MVLYTDRDCCSHFGQSKYQVSCMIVLGLSFCPSFANCFDLYYSTACMHDVTVNQTLIIQVNDLSFSLYSQSGNTLRPKAEEDLETQIDEGFEDLGDGELCDLSVAPPPNSDLSTMATCETDAEESDNDGEVC